MTALRESLHFVECTTLLKEILFKTKYIFLAMSNFCQVYVTSAFKIKGLLIFSSAAVTPCVTDSLKSTPESFI